MDEKTLYEKKMEAEMKNLNASISELKAKAAKASAEAQKKYLDQVEHIQGQRKALENKLQDLKQSGLDSWKNLQGEVEDRWQRMKNAVEAAKKELHGEE